MSPEEALRAAASAAQSVMAAHDGRYVDAARHAIDAALELVPADEAAKLLDEAAIRRANAIADAVEAAKFGNLHELDDAGDEPTNPGTR
jgi:hypothetical protein